MRYLPNFDLSSAFSAAAGNARAVDRLIEQLGDRSASVRVHAAEFLGMSGDLRAVGPLIYVLRDENPDVRSVAATALANLGDRRAVDPLIEALQDASSGAHLRFVAKALGDLGDLAAVDPLIDNLGHEIGQMRSFVAMALAKLGDARAIPALIQLLEGNGPRGVVASALADFDQPAVQPLIGLLNHLEKDVRLFAADALSKIKDPAAAGPLTQLLADEHILVRTKAVKALVQIGPASIPYLLEALKSDDVNAVVSSCEALGDLRDARAIEPLKQLLDHEDDLVRAKAAKAFTKLDS